jgi:hypothetical protein
MQSVSMTVSVTNEIVSLDGHEMAFALLYGASSRSLASKRPRLLTRCLPALKATLAKIRYILDFIGAPDTI